jgi:hypothetical protein
MIAKMAGYAFGSNPPLSYELTRKTAVPAAL